MFGDKSFNILGVNECMVAKVEHIGWHEPSEIQTKVIPLMLKGNDVIALAETGSGKTGAFAIPILQQLYESPRENFALILTPTHELAVQIKDEFMKIGGQDPLKVITLLGGDFVEDQLKLLKSDSYHIVVGTPGRVVLHIQKTLALKLRKTRFFILDEADRMLSDDFVADIEAIVAALHNNHQTCLFSATMTNKLEKLEAACLKNPIRVDVSRKHQTVEKLRQEMVTVFDDVDKLVFIAWKLQSKCINSEVDQELSSSIVFTETREETILLYNILKNLDISVAMLQGEMQRCERQNAIDDFKKGSVSVLVATDIASRGLDIPTVGLVINYNTPTSSTAYQHRVGRTARAGRTGMSITLATEYEGFEKGLRLIEKDTRVKMSRVPVPWDQTEDLRSQIIPMIDDVKRELKEQNFVEKMKKQNKSKTQERPEEMTKAKEKKKAQEKKMNKHVNRKRKRSE